MSVFNKVILILSFFGMWISHIISEDNLIVLGYFLILSFGIFHGANDLELIQKNNTINNKGNSKNKIRFLISYIISVLFFSVCFYFFPLIGFIIFMVISAYHFGEQHLNFKVYDSLNLNILAFRFFYGSLILSILLFFHKEEVSKIILNITSFEVKSILFNYILILTIAFTILFYFLSKNYMSKDFFIFFEVFLLIVFSLIFKFSPLIWGFSLYFILWHSIPSIKSQSEFIYGEFSYLTFIKYLKSGFLIWLLSIVSFILYFYLMKNNSMLETILFSFIAAITFPHVFTIFNIFQKKTE
ncbi:Brp/Blh family beta-carotene 15,15'-dioxygenase [Flavobacterium gelidilacus]|uniref:Brp/Blh family beta-carotene 15,15'-dioxygenase n=1 Tax=Flavobacterium gelidilacus TaxID=206041 RepID=UPI000409FA30|nr:Brp/Blh family beta-carotene 15,15'-dioxygenase [Flavobacterium gelidilacus]